MRPRTSTAALAALGAVALAGCGGSSTTTSTSASGPGNVVDVIASLPLTGPARAQGRAIDRGARLALAQAGSHAGSWRVAYVPLNDASPSNSWDEARTAANARHAAGDSRAVYYIGELDSAASEVSMPILNVAGVPQLSPTNTYVGLTTNDPGSARDEPRKYFPTGKRTYLRIAPRDSVEAGADLLAMSQSACTKVAIASDGSRYGQGLASLVELQRIGFGLTVTNNAAIDPTAADYRPFAVRVKTQRADCLLWSGAASPAGARLARDVHAANPALRIFAPNRACTSAFARALPAAVAALLQCTLFLQRVSAYPGGHAFATIYRARYGSFPDPYALYGYEAMNLALATIARLGPHGNDKLAVRDALFDITARRSAIGVYGFDRDGDTTLRSYGLYRVGRDGGLAFMRTLAIGRVGAHAK